MGTQAARLSRAGQLPRQLLRFCAAGAVGTAAHYLTLGLLVHAGWHATLATCVGAVAGALVNYGLNYRYTFHSWRPHRIAMSRFGAIAAIGWLLNGVVFALLHQGARLPLWPAQLLTTALVLAWNFAGNRWWTFGGERHE